MITSDNLGTNDKRNPLNTLTTVKNVFHDIILNTTPFSIRLYQPPLCYRMCLRQPFQSLTSSLVPVTDIIIHQTHYEKSDWSRAFNQFTIACELDMINAISAVDIAFIMSSSTSAWLPSPLECSPQKQNS